MAQGNFEPKDPSCIGKDGEPKAPEHRKAALKAERKWAINEPIKTEEKTDTGETADAPAFANQIKKAVAENPDRLKHGDTATNAFFIDGDKIVPYNKWKEVISSKNVISVHSHSAEGWKTRTEKTEPFQPLNGGDLEGLQHMVKYGYGDTIAVISGFGELEYIKFTPESDRSFLKLSKQKLHKAHELPLEYRTEENYRKLMKSFCEHYKMRYVTGLRWKSEGASFDTNQPRDKSGISAGAQTKELSPKGMTKTEFTSKFVKVYRGDNQAIQPGDFDFSKIQTRDEGYFGKGAYFTEKPELAKNYGSVINIFYVQKDKLYEPKYETSADDFTNHQRLVKEVLGITPEYGDFSNSPKITEKLQEQGYDGLRTQHSGEVVVFDPQTINHIDPETQYEAYMAVYPEHIGEVAVSRRKFLTPTSVATKRTATLKENHAVVGMTLTEFKRTNPVGFKYDPQLDLDGIVARRSADKVTYLSDKFFRFDKKHQERLLRHEVGHDLLRGDDYNVYWAGVLAPFTSGGRGARIQFDNFFGAGKDPEEVIADTYQALWEDNQWKPYESDKVRNLLKQVVAVSKIKNVPLPDGIEEKLGMKKT